MKAEQIWLQNVQNAGNKNLAFTQQQAQRDLEIVQENAKGSDKRREQAFSSGNQMLHDLYQHFKALTEISIKCSHELFDLYSAKCDMMTRECAKNNKPQQAKA